MNHPHDTRRSDDPGQGVGAHGHDHARHDHEHGHEHQHGEHGQGHDHGDHHDDHGHGNEHAHDEHDHHGHGHHHGHHGHSHGGGHGHSHAPASFGQAFAIGIVLNLGFVIIEVIYGIVAHSLALVADAGHNLSDVLGLMLAWTATVLVKRLPTQRRTYGLRRSSILVSLFNALVLLIGVGGIAWEAIQRLQYPAPIASHVVMVVAAIGIAVNGLTAWLFASGRKGDVNIRGAFTHMAADALISLGVVLAALAISFTGWSWIDPVVSLAIVVTIAIGTWRLLRESLDLALDAVPGHIHPEQVEAYLSALPGVVAVHDLHIWGMSTTESALTVHLVKPSATVDDALLARINRDLRKRFGIGHVTVQFELGDDAHPCGQASASAL